MPRQARKRQHAQPHLKEYISKPCGICSKLLTTVAPAMRTVFFYRCIKGCENGAQQGCDLCRMVLKCPATSQLHASGFRVCKRLRLRLCKTFERDRAEQEQKTPNDFNTLEISLFSPSLARWTMRGRNIDGWLQVSRHYVFAAFDDPAAGYVTARPFQREVNSDSSFQQALQWIAQCSKHPYCPNLEPSELPRRVIDIGPSKGSIGPRLYITRGERSFYTALSYCWGVSKQQSTLTMSNLSDFVKDIRLASLPKTIRDAIYVTRRLGIRYLWVDALCIMQDSIEDKSLEIEHMHEIYGRASVTISAATAVSCEGGFLHDRVHPSLLGNPAVNFSTFKLHYLCPDNRIGNLILEDAHKRWYPSMEPLYNRGWAFGERLLSSRLLVYGTRHLWWQCTSANYSCGGDTLGDSSGRPSRLPDIIYRGLPGLPQQPQERLASLKRLRGSWRRRVMEFSQCKLSNIEDTLSAIGGVASRYGIAMYLARNNSPISYAAGLWNDGARFQNNILLDLFWQVRRFDRPPYGPQKYLPTLSRPYIAPSFSWAGANLCLEFPSINYPIWDEDHMEDSPCELIECETELVRSSATFGPVKSGFIILNGAVRDVKWRHGDHNMVLLDPLEDEGDYIFPITATLDGPMDEYEPDCSFLCLQILKCGGLVLKAVGKNFQRCGAFYLSENQVIENKGKLSSSYNVKPTECSWFDACVKKTINIL